jgi:hypothetical protein
MWGMMSKWAMNKMGGGNKAQDNSYQKKTSSQERAENRGPQSDIPGWLNQIMNIQPANNTAANSSIFPNQMATGPGMQPGMVNPSAVQAGQDGQQNAIMEWLMKLYQQQGR